MEARTYKVNRISDYVWEIPVSEKEGMQVPARIYASEKLFKEMDAGVFEQITNVACLPGIQKYAIALPDSHWGYGAPVGAVGAFDLEEGIISPGKIGFDINCLAGNAKILTENGYKRIEKFSWKDKIATKGGKKIAFVRPLAFMKRFAKHGLVIDSETGYTVSVTKEHPILTQKGMIEAGKLKYGEEIQVLKEEKLVWDKVVEIREKKFNGFVYDFTIPETHNFVANGIVLSNCGMRLLTTNLTIKEVQPKIKELVNELFQKVPVGVGKRGFVNLNKSKFVEVMETGAKWCVENGYGWKEDLDRIEAHGAIKGADSNKVSAKAIQRGMDQLGTLGSGNHYLEVQVAHASEIYDKEIASAFGIHSPEQIVIMVHCGSRGFGHQVATDYLNTFEPAMRKYGITVKDRQLACAPFSSQEGKDYYAAMACAANNAFANRQIITHQIRECFKNVFHKSPEEMEMGITYDVAHNIAKVEEHLIDGKKKKVLVHRKGATRSFGPGHEELWDAYKKYGQPVIVGGSMETGSFLLVGTETAMKETFGSTLHGSGRTMSRTKAKKMASGEQLQKEMEKRGIYVKAASYSGLAEEAGFAYKPISDVVDAVHNAGISKRVAGLKPIGNIKG